MKFNVVVSRNSVSIGPKDTTDDMAFFYDALINIKTGKVMGYAMQANHNDPEWPEIVPVLKDLAEDAYKAFKKTKKALGED